MAPLTGEAQCCRNRVLSGVLRMLRRLQQMWCLLLRTPKTWLQKQFLVENRLSMRNFGSCVPVWLWTGRQSSEDPCRILSIVESLMGHTPRVLQ